MWYPSVNLCAIVKNTKMKSLTFKNCKSLLVELETNDQAKKERKKQTNKKYWNTEERKKQTNKLKRNYTKRKKPETKKQIIDKEIERN